MRNTTLRCLLDGNYICEYAFPQEYTYLTSDTNEAFVNKWLSAIDMRLARVGEDGAFFMAPQNLSKEDNARIRDEFLRFRDVYGPAIRMLQVIRNAKDEFSLNPGEYIQHAELAQKVNEIAALAEQLRSLVGIIRETDARYTNAELVKRLLEHLRKDGYLVIVDTATEMYRSTGKVMQLTQVLRFLGENAEFARSNQDESELIDVTDDLFDRPMQP
jgi:hypothetical protein